MQGHCEQLYLRDLNYLFISPSTKASISLRSGTYQALTFLPIFIAGNTDIPALRIRPKFVAISITSISIAGCLFLYLEVPLQHTCILDRLLIYKIQFSLNYSCRFLFDFFLYAIGCYYQISSLYLSM